MAYIVNNLFEDDSSDLSIESIFFTSCLDFTDKTAKPWDSKVRKKGAKTTSTASLSSSVCSLCV